MTAALKGLRYCVMQPYFFPYAGYYRLLLDTDVFVVFDSAQFPRRGRVHRCEAWTADGRLTWLTLPLRKSPRDSRISDMVFAPDAAATLAERVRRTPGAARTLNDDPELASLVMNPQGRLLPYLQAQLEFTAKALGSRATLVRASELLPRAGMHYQQYILALGAVLGATEYVNPPGGRHLYQAQAFEEAGIDLTFLAPYVGLPVSVLESGLQQRTSLRSLVAAGSSVHRLSPSVNA